MADDYEALLVTEPLSQEEIDLFGNYKKLIPINIEGRIFHVPEKNTVLRALQYLEIRKKKLTMKWGRFCWNNTVGCCELSYRSSTQEPETRGRGCQILVKPGLHITELPKGGCFIEGSE